MNQREQTGMEVDDSNTAEVKSVDYETGTVRECSDMPANVAISGDTLLQ